ncbi:MAG TPA: hypothetical protein VI461_16005 [Chitinophagaceae bacterium]|nr:hypothetical protein [Chitinophagaceae bacterium]
MSALLSLNKTIEDIVTEFSKLNEMERQSVLAYTRALNMKKEKRKPVARYGKNIKPLSLKEIDKIKHRSRKAHANK